MTRCSRKGQVLSADLFIGIGVFLFALALGFWIWNYSLEKVEQRENTADLELVAHRAYNVLFYTSGYPADWHNESVLTLANTRTIGLRSGYVLDSAKIARLMALTTTERERLLTFLGVRGPGYNVSVAEFAYTNPNFAVSATNRVNTVPASATQVVSREFVGIDQTGSFVKLTLQVWR